MNIKVCGYEYDVRTVEDTLESKAWGSFNADKKEICIQEDVTPEHSKEVLMHEILHVLCYIFQAKLSERDIICLEKGLCRLLADNPEFLALFSRPGKGVKDACS